MTRPPMINGVCDGDGSLRFPACLPALQAIDQPDHRKGRSNAQKQHHHDVHATDRAAELDKRHRLIEQAVGQGSRRRPAADRCAPVDFEHRSQRQQGEKHRAEQVKPGRCAELTRLLRRVCVASKAMPARTSTRETGENRVFAGCSGK